MSFLRNMPLTWAFLNTLWKVSWSAAGQSPCGSSGSRRPICWPSCSRSASAACRASLCCRSSCAMRPSQCWRAACSCSSASSSPSSSPSPSVPRGPLSSSCSNSARRAWSCCSVRSSRSIAKILTRAVFRTAARRASSADSSCQRSLSPFRARRSMLARMACDCCICCGCRSLASPDPGAVLDCLTAGCSPSLLALLLLLLWWMPRLQAILSRSFISRS
mmetsp:Transcript_1565/g.2190  ORF Transcript_1565/g.2190 Transcript_1565/m.2190 type:complete len:219 (-) Transcript_1565:467-1123(-)